MIEKTGKNLNTVSEIVSKKEQRKEDKKLATIKPQRGHTLFEWNSKEGTIEKATFEKMDVSWLDAKNLNKPKNRKIIVKPNCVYIPALNKKNVIKKIKRNYDTN